MHHYDTAKQQITALKDKTISAAELLEIYKARFNQLNPFLKAINYDNFAASADYIRQHSENLLRRPLAGLPITIKDAIHVKGMPTTGGMIEPENCIADEDAMLTHIVKLTGGVIIGKTNTPVANSDWQTVNPLFGRSLNPWNPAYTPGGSTGGGAAAVASGISAMEFGSDIGGSIRIPAAFCGLYGHKASAGVVPSSGHFPAGITPNSLQQMMVMGPITRSAYDLQIAMGLLARPEQIEGKAWRLSMPPARHEKLKDYRVGFLKMPKWLEIEESILTAQENLKQKLTEEKCQIIELDCEDKFGNYRDYYSHYLIALQSIISGGLTAEKRTRAAEKLRAADDDFLQAIAEGLTCHGSQFINMVEIAEKYKRLWELQFRDVDVIISPVTFSNAFKHDDNDFYDRNLDINMRQNPYYRLSFLPALASFSGIPATVFPTGETTSHGLPVGLQAMGAYLEDNTTIGFCQLLEEAFGGFNPPPEG